jgi:hypothetical protein
VHDLVIHPRESLLIIGTHGRGAWAMDISMLQALTEEMLDSKLMVLPKLSNEATLPFGGRSRFSRSEPARIPLYVKSKGKIEVSIKDKTGQPVKDFTYDASAGFNFIPWDLTTNAKEKTLVEAGTYQISFSSGSASVGQTIVVKKPAAPQQRGGDFLEEPLERERQ